MWSSPASTTAALLGPVPAHVGVLEHVAAAVDAGTFAVPDAVDAVDLRTGEQVHALAAHYRGGGQFLVHRRLVHDAMLVEQSADARQGQIVPGQRRAFVTGDEGAGSQPGSGIAPLLIDGKPHQRLNSRQINAAFKHGVFVVKCDRHEQFSPASSGAGKWAIKCIIFHALYFFGEYRVNAAGGLNTGPKSVTLARRKRLICPKRGPSL